MTLLSQLADWASGVGIADIPERVLSYAKSQILSQLAAARAGAENDLGAKVVRAFGPPLQDDPRRSAYVLAALTMVLDFDDTVYAGHVTHSSVNVPLAYQRRLALDGESLLAATVVASECAARVTAAATLGTFRGQTAGHTHLTGAVAARLHAEGAAAQRYVDAWGLAFGMPPWSLPRAFLGSDAKLFIASTPIAAGLDACAAAAAGLSGAADVLEHAEGFLARFAAVAVPEEVTAGLGERWHTETASFKVYPGCAYLDAAIDCAVELSSSFTPEELAAAEAVVVRVPLFTFAMDARSAPFLDGPGSQLPALSFSVAYNLATALLTGALTPDDLDPQRVGDPNRWALAGKVRIELDEELTRQSVLATAPLGEALARAGERGVEWLRQTGGEEAVRLVGELPPPAADFSQATKRVGARVEVRLSDGSIAEAAAFLAVGAASDDTRRRHGSLMRAKFLACGGTKSTADALANVEQLDATTLGEVIAAALA